MNTIIVRVSFFFYVALASVLVGCGAPSDDSDNEGTAEGAYTLDTAGGVSWRKVLSCDHGAAVLDVNRSDARDLQFVVRDRNITRYLRGQMENVPEDDPAVANDPRFQPFIQPVLNARGELIVWGNDVQNPVVSASDFGKDDLVYSHAYRLGRYFVVVKREGAGIKLIVADRLRMECVGGQALYQGGCINASAFRAHVEHEVANWYFQDCH